MQSREEDVVWRVKMADTMLYLYLLLEFQSTPDAAMPVRMVQYVAALYDSLIKEKRVDPRRLPPVLPVVLYNGERRWRVATDVGEVIECPPVLRAYQPRLRYYLLDEGAYSDHELAAVRNVVAGIFALENAEGKEEALAVVRRIGEALQALPNRERIDRVLTQWVKRYLQRVHPGAMMAVEETLERGEGTMLATNVQKWAEALLREGVQQGIHRGQHEGKLWALRQLLRVRFPEADLTPYQSRLDAATDAELEHLLTKAATAATPDAVFATE
jgi:predicted transposase/invertase (TIGR01784 family)